MEITFNCQTREGSFQMHKKHYHSYYELFYMQSGTCKFFVDHTIYHVETGDVILLSPLALHQTTYPPGIKSKRMVIFMGNHYLSKHDERQQKLIAGIFETIQISIVLEKRSFIEGLLTHIAFELNHPDEYSQLLLQGYLKELMVFLGRSKKKPQSSKGDPTDHAIQTVVEYIYHHYSNPLTLGEMAAMAAMSPAYFSRKFKKVTGFGYKEYLNHLRLKEATRRLQETKETITAIALACGYSDSNYFGDVFYKVNGMSPREFRKAGRAIQNQIAVLES